MFPSIPKRPPKPISSIIFNTRIPNLSGVHLYGSWDGFQQPTPLTRSSSNQPFGIYPFHILPVQSGQSYLFYFEYYLSGNQGIPTQSEGYDVEFCSTVNHLCNKAILLEDENEELNWRMKRKEDEKKIIYPYEEGIVSIVVLGSLDQYKPHPMILNESARRFEIPVSELGVMDPASSDIHFYFSVTSKHEFVSPNYNGIVKDGRLYNRDILGTEQQFKDATTQRPFYRIRYPYRPTIKAVTVAGEWDNFTPHDAPLISQKAGYGLKCEGLIAELPKSYSFIWTVTETEDRITNAYGRTADATHKYNTLPFRPSQPIQLSTMIASHPSFGCLTSPQDHKFQIQQTSHSPLTFSITQLAAPPANQLMTCYLNSILHPGMYRLFVPFSSQLTSLLSLQHSHFSPIRPYSHRIHACSRCCTKV